MKKGVKQSGKSVNSAKRFFGKIFGISGKSRKGNMQAEQEHEIKKISYAHNYGKYNALPVHSELEEFYRDPEAEILIISSKNKKGKPVGYVLIAKKEYVQSDMDYFRSKMGVSHSQNLLAREHPFSKEYVKQWKANSVKRFLALIKDLKSEIRFIAAGGYYFDEQTGTFERKNHGLAEGISAAVLGFVFIFLIAKAPVTGGVIANVITSNYGIGLTELFIAILAAATYFALKPYKKK